MSYDPSPPTFEGQGLWMVRFQRSVDHTDGETTIENETEIVMAPHIGAVVDGVREEWPDATIAACELMQDGADIIDGREKWKE